ncbi:MAG: carboxypeptidase regulatory-like domain-containing protein [Acidobacteriota bacterium]|nr:carboxypeptidase regulatory-like domain-containing protein [Acidobacteriota bacterium]
MLSRRLSPLFALLLAVLITVPPAAVFAADHPVSPGPMVVTVKSAQDQAPIGGVAVTLGGRVCTTLPDGTVTFDGVPGGKQVLRIEHIGWNRLTRVLTLPLGQREPLEILLTPVAPVRFTGTVVIDDGRPIAGARLKMKPVKVVSAVQGNYEWVTGWDGTFTVLQVPAGAYSVEVSAPGCATGTFETDIQPEMQAPTYTLTRESDEAGIVVVVKDALSGTPVPGATVTVAEAWPHGVIARGKTGGDGSVSLVGLKVGRINWDTEDPFDTMIGTWWCDPGYFLSFERDGDGALGRFLPWQGEMQGALSREGKTFTGRWSELYMRGDPNVGGRINLDLADDPWVFGGKHGYNDEEPAHGWAGRRIRTSTVALCRPQVTVYVEAGGHEPTAVPATIGSGIVEVRVNPNGVIEEREPNNEIASAQQVVTGAPVKLKIQPAGDRDHFRFRLPIPARVRLETHVGTEWSRIKLLKPDGTVIADQGLPGGDAARSHECGELPAGDYIVCFEQFSNNAEVLTDTFFRVVCTWIPDPFEPNDTVMQARNIRSGEEVRGYIAPRGDLDYFRFEVKRPSVVRFSTPRFTTIWRRVQVMDDRDKVIADWGHPSGGLGDIQLAPGVYYVRMMDYGNNGSSPEPYTLRMEMIEDDLLDDTVQPEGRVASIRTLALGESVSNTVFPNRDVDFYTLTIPCAGRVHARLVKPPEIWMRTKVLDGTGTVLAEHGQPNEGPEEAVFEVDGPKTVYIRVGDLGDNGSSPNPYTLSAWMEPCDELETMGGNDTAATASPLELGEWVRASILPTGDDDWYQIQLDFPGVLLVEHPPHPIWTRLILCNEKGEQIAEQGVTGGGANWEIPLASGQYFLVVREFGDNGSHPSPYSVRAVLKRAEPQEKEPLATDPIRTLAPGEAQAFYLDQRGDKDHFVFNMANEGKFRITINKPGTLWVRAFLFDDRTGEQLAEWGITGGFHTELEAKGATRYRLRIQDFGDNGASPEPGFVKFDLEDRPIGADRVTAQADPFDPTLVSFARAELGNAQRAAAVQVDANSDGTPDVDIPADAPATFRYPAEGLYKATVVMETGQGARTRMPIWVEAIGPKRRKGVYVRVDNPGEGQVVDADIPAQARAMSWSGAKIARVSFSVDGRAIETDYAPPFEAHIPWRDLMGEKHTLAVTAADESGLQTTVKREFSVSEYFDLTPTDAAVVTGNAVRVSWIGRDFGPTRVRYRAKGDEAWQDAVGDNGREHAVLLTGLEAGQAYEFQPIGRGEPGPVRTVTRVKGLAFGRTRYGATINRDYDQRVPISVRNHAEQPMMVKLVCGRPADPDLLLGFVGEGSEGKPFSLEPGEEREFMLVFSAQDVCTPNHTVPVRITSDSGYSDEAEVAVEVRLPEVKLVWEELGPDESGTGMKLRLTNAGDNLTDLSLASDNERLAVDPAVDHGVFPAGQSMEVLARPVLFEGYTGVKGNVTASALRKPTSHPVELALKEGEQVYAVDLAPTDTGEAGAYDDSDLMGARALAGALLNPSVVDWSAKQSPKDTDGDGRPDRWNVVDEIEGITWVADDTDGNGEVDFVHADIGNDGQFDYSGIKTETGWDRTNMLETWLEMDFKLPGSRDSYEKHNVDVVMNGTVVGRLQDMLPEGNYTFKVPPTAIQFGADGSPSGNVVEIQSTHLRGGHYVVSSNFQLNARLTNTRALTIATSREEAVQKVREENSIVADKPDFALSSSEIRAEGEVKGGAEVPISIPLRNLGAVPGYCVGVSLQVADPGQTPAEVDFKCFEYIPASGSTPVRLVWNATPGEHRLRMVVDPEGTAQDANPGNNEAYITLTVPGDAGQPTLKVLEPADGATVQDPVVPLKVEATDDVRIARVSVSVDGGLWSPLGFLGGAYEAKSLLQPGQHRLTFRAVDGSGNAATQTCSVTVNAAAPEVRIDEPGAGARIDSRTAKMRVTCAPDCVVVGARSNGGPWVTAKPVQGRAQVAVGLSFGKNTLEVFAANAKGLRGSATVDVECTKQRDEPKEEPKEPGGQGGAGEQGQGGGRQPAGGDEPGDEGETGGPPGTTVDVDGVGPVDVSQAGNQVIPPEGAPLGDGGVGGGTAEGETGEEIADEPLPEISPEDDAILEELENSPLDETETESEVYDGTGGDEVLPDDITVPPLEQGVPPHVIASGPGFQWDCDAAPVQAPPGSDPGLLPPRPTARPRGGCVCVQQRQSDWYCTNRPKVGVKFRLPDKLKHYGEHLKPGSKEFFEEMGKLLARLKMQGVDTTNIEKMWKVMRERAGRVQSPEELPGWLQSFGLSSGPTGDPAKDKDWQEKMKNAADAWMLKLLASGDPEMIAAGVKARLEALGQFDQAAQEAAEAAIIQIQANQKITELAIGMLPAAGLVFDSVAYFGYNGESLSGEQITAGRMAFSALFTIGPYGIAKALQTVKGRQILAAIGNKAALWGAEGEAKLAQVLGMEQANLHQGLKWIWEGLTKERHLWGGRASNAAKASGITLARQREAARTAERLMRKVDEKMANRLIDRIAKTTDRKEFRKLVAQLQQNKTAQALINNPKIPDSLRLRVNRTITAQNRLVDMKTIKELRNSPGVQKAVSHYAQKLNCPEEQIFVRARQITGNKAAKVGRDRDVWYEVCRKRPDGTIQKLQDVHHDIVKPIYDKNLRSVTGKYMGGAELGVDDLDHAITGRWNPETYNTGKVDPQRLVNKETGEILAAAAAGDEEAMAIARELAGHADDLGDTAALKVLERVEKAKKLREAGRIMEAERELAEGMRQATKEFDRHVQPYLDAIAKSKGLTPEQARALVPPRLQQAIDQMRLAEQSLDAGGMAASEVESVINSLTCSKGLSRTPVGTETVAGDLSSFIKMLYKYGLKTQ